MKFNNIQAYSEGWGLFTVNTGGLEILVLDDPQAARPKACRCVDTKTYCCRACRDAGFSAQVSESPFRFDDEALSFVMDKAKQGSPYHKKAIKLAAGIAR